MAKQLRRGMPKTTNKVEASSQKISRTVSMELLAPILGRFSVVDIASVRFAAVAHRPSYGLKPEDVSQRIRYRCTRLPDGEPDSVLGWIEFEYNASIQGENIASVDGSFAVLYTLKDAAATLDLAQSESLDICTEVNGLFNTWPYIRELVSSSLARLGLPKLTLPTFRIPSELPPKGEFAEMSTEDAPPVPRGT